MRNFTTTELLRLLTSLDSGAVDLTKRITSLLDGLITLGFHSAQFYLKVESGTDSKSDVIQITSYSYRDPPIRSLLGIKIAFADTTIYRNGHVEAGYSIGSSGDHSDVSWPEELVLNDTFWIDLLISNPVTHEIHGLLAVSWSGSRDLLTEDSISALQLVSSRVGTWITERSALIAHVRETVETHFHVDQHTGSLTSDTLDQIMEFLVTYFNSDCVACFIYNFVTERVTKLRELTKTLKPSDRMLPEEYVVGSHLTGKAFNRVDLCFIPDFLQFVRTNPTDVSPDSVRYHDSLIGGIRSCLYGHIRFGRHRYFFRLFRAASSESGIFSKKDRDDLGAACERLSFRLERDVRDFQLKRIRSAATDGFRRLRESRDHYEELTDYLEATGVEYFLIAIQDAGDGAPDVEWANGAFRKYVDSSTWGSTELATTIAANDKLDTLTVARVADITPAARRQALRAEIDGGYDEICLMAARSINTTTTLLFLRYGLRTSVHDEGVGLPQNEQEFLLSLLSVYAAANEAKKSLITADKADHMLADLGHEVGTPVSTLTQTAILACDRTIIAMKTIQRNSAGVQVVGDVDLVTTNATIAELEQFKSEVNDLGGLVQIITEIPRALAQLGGDQIEMDFQVHSWSDLIDDIWSDALDWSKVLNEKELGVGRVSKGSFALKRSDNMTGKSIVGDRAFLRMAIGNIVKNAMKYSLPRYRHEAMEIGIFLEPQGGIHYLNIRNWGVGIPSESFKRIFGKYERIERKDRMRTIRGRGIGLYLARTFVRAHGGDVICHSSVSTLDDPARVQQLEGYETQFRLWLPSTAVIGKRKARI